MNTTGKGRGWRRSAAVLMSLALVVTATVGDWLGSGPVEPVAAAQETTTDGVAQTEIEARTEAAASGQPVEVLAFRNERRDVLANPDGTMTVTQHVAPVRTIKEGGWVAVDPALEQRSDGRLAPAAATVDVVFSGGGDGPLVELRKNGRGVALGWGTTLPAPVVDGATATYPDVLPGVDLVLTALVDGFSHTLVVKTAQAAANPAVAAIDLPLTLDGTEVRVTGSGGVEIVDAASGGVMLAADAPMMWDSGGGQAEPAALSVTSQARAEVEVSVAAGSVTLVPDQALLTSPDTTYPVYIDPVYRDEFRSAWTMVDSGYPNEEYWKFDGSNNEGLGRCPVSSGACNNSKVKRLFYRVSSSFYRGKEVLSAQFVAVLKDNWSHRNVSDRVNLYLMSSGISSSTNWSNQPSGTHVANADPPTPSFDCSGLDDGGTEWSVTPEVRSAADAGKSSLTFGLRNATETDSTKWMRFCDDAYLQVRYNTRPTLPDTDDLSTSPGAGCTYALDEDSYINRLPTLRAYLFDADHGKTNEWGGDEGPVSEQLRAEFRLLWGSSSWTSPLTSKKASGSLFTLVLADAPDLPDLPYDTPIGWIVRATDGFHWSSWSWSGEQSRCRFVIDPTAPDPPEIASADFPDDGSWTDRLGIYGSFTLTSTSSDVVRYRYDFTNDSAGPATVDAAADGSASISFMPSRRGPHVLTVEAFDRAANSSVNSSTFAVSARPAAGAWNLADPAGSGQAADAAGTNPAAAGAGVTFGVDGPGANSAVRLDGSPGAYLAAPARAVADTGAAFAASAWVRVADLSRDQTAVSVDGTGEAGFALGYHAAEQAWSFEIPDFDLYRFTVWRVTSAAGSVEAGEWAHLLAAYDPGSASMRLYVNGSLAATGQRGSTWNGIGAVQIGRSYREGRYAGHWDGDLAEVRVFDRMVFADEAVELSTLAPQRQGYWQLNEAPGGESPEYTGGPPLVLGGGAEIYQQVDPILDPRPLLGTGHLQLDGVDGYAATGGPVVDTGDSFTVTARVRLASAQPTESMTVLSASGTNASMFTVRYSADLDAWELVVALADAAGGDTVSVVSSELPSAGPSGQLLAVVYNAFTDQLTLYVDGVASAPLAEPFDDPWTAGGGLQVGRSLVGTAPGEHLSGAVDEVRAYTGVADAATIQRLGEREEQPDL